MWVPVKVLSLQLGEELEKCREKVHKPACRVWKVEELSALGYVVTPTYLRKNDIRGVIFVSAIGDD